MAIYLNNINLNGNQLQKAVIHPLSTAPSTAAEGQVYYDLEDNVVYVNTSTNVNSPTWVNMQSGDLTGVTAAAGLTGTATSGAVTLAVGAGTGMTVNADDIAVTAAQTGITSILNASLTKIGTAGAQEYLTFGTSNEVNTFVNNTERLSVTATGVDITGALTVSGSYGLASGDIPNNAADTSGTAAAVTNATLTTALTVNTGTLTLTANSANNSVVTIGAGAVGLSGSNTGDQSASDVLTLIEDGVDSVHYKDGSIDTEHIADAQITVGKMAANSVDSDQYVDGSVDMAHLAAIATDTFIGRTAANAGVPKALSKAEALAILNVADGAQVNVAPSTSQVKTALNADLGGNITIGTQSDDTVSFAGSLNVAGNVTLSGDVVLESTTNTAIKDKILLLNQGQDGAPNANNDMGVLWSRGFGTTNGLNNVMFVWDEGDLEFQLICTQATGAEAAGVALAEGNTLGTSGYQALRVGKLLGPVTGNVTGNVSGSSGSTTGNAATVTTNANLTGDVTSSGNATTIAAGVVHHSMLAEDYISGQGSITALTQTDLLAVHDTSATEVKQISLTNFEDQIFSNINAASSHIAIAAGGAITVNTLNQNTTGTAGSISGITNANIVQKVETQTLTNKTLTSPVLNTGVSGTAIKDEDDLTSNSASHLATQQSIKAYVDAQTSGDSNTGGRQSFVLNDSVDGVAVSNSNKTYTITHGMGSSFNYGVEVIRNAANSGGGETVYTDVTRTTTTVVINFATAPTAGNFTALVCKY